MGLVVFPLVRIFDPRLVGHERRGPDLAVRMWVRTSHYGAFIFKDLNPVVFDTQFCSLPNPSANVYASPIQFLLHDRDEM